MHYEWESKQFLRSLPCFFHLLKTCSHNASIIVSFLLLELEWIFKVKQIWCVCVRVCVCVCDIFIFIFEKLGWANSWIWANAAKAFHCSFSISIQILSKVKHGVQKFSWPSFIKKSIKPLWLRINLRRMSKFHALLLSVYF